MRPPRYDYPMKRGGVFFAIEALLVVMIGGMVAYGWSTHRDRHVTPAYEDAAIWAPDRWERMELLDVDSDGSLLVAFYDGAREVASGLGRPDLAGQQPGIALVTPDGATHVLHKPSALDRDAIGSAVGSVHRGSIAVSWQVIEGAVSPENKLTYLSNGSTVALATGTVNGLSGAPTPTVDGLPVVVKWGGLHVADGALVAYVVEQTDGISGLQFVGLLDATTGIVSVIENGIFLAPMRDLCDQAGNTFGIPAVDDGGVAIHQFEVVGGHASAATAITSPPDSGSMLPINACGTDIAGMTGKTRTLSWTNGAGDTSSVKMSDIAGDVFLAPQWLAAHKISVEGQTAELVVVDRFTGVTTNVGETCDRVVPAGDWIAFGYPEGDTCRPVAVPASVLLSP